jgi:hypothetical protein
MVPAFAREHEGFNVRRVVIETRSDEDRARHVAAMHRQRDDVFQTIALCDRSTSLEVDARCHGDVTGQVGEVRLDISFHGRRASNGARR